MPTAAALPADAPPRPRYWERLVLYSYARMQGSTQQAAASAVGRSRRTAQSWEENRSLYAEARAEAKARWLSELEDVSRTTLMAAIRGGQGELALRVLERLDGALAPPAQRLKHEGTVDLVASPAWLELRVQILQVLAPYPEARAQLAEMLSDAPSNGTGQ